MNPNKKFNFSLVFNGRSNLLKLFNSYGELLHSCECRNQAVNPGYGHWGLCPPGKYLLGVPQRLKKVAANIPYGRYFIPVLSVPGREGIGIHGGGSGLSDPWEDFQGWVITQGCFRVQNISAALFAQIIMLSQSLGGKCRLEVVQ